jgi:hypothetical protein
MSTGRIPNPYIPAGRGFLDDVIDHGKPQEDHPRAGDAQNKADRNPPKHGNIPL